MTIRQVLIICLFAAGTGLTIVGLIRYFLLNKPRPAKSIAFEPAVDADAFRTRWTKWLFLLLIISAAFVFRIEGTDLRGMSHVEVYIPGIPLPEGISEPPPRIGIKETVIWQWHNEPHPQGYYLTMWSWTKLFGTDIGTLRLPSVIFSIGTIFVVYLLATRLFGTWVGLASAVLLALNGHQIYWSQNARMYVMAMFLGVLSTFLLTELLLQTRMQRLKEIAYVAVTWMGVFTQIFFWPFLAGHMLYVAWYIRGKNTETPRILKLQSIVAILGAPMWAHAVYTSRDIVIGYPSFEFLQQFLTFAFLFQPDHLSFPSRYVSLYITAPLTIIALFLLVMALRNKSSSLALNPRFETSSIAALVPISVGLSFIVLALAWWSWRRQVPMAMTAVVPFLVLLIVPLAGNPLNKVRNYMRHSFGEQPVMTNTVALLFMCCFVPTLLLFILGLIRPLIMDRGFLLLTPYLIILLVLGLKQTASNKLLFSLLVVMLGAAHVYSMNYYRTKPGANDYRATAEQIVANFEPEDIVFVHKSSWVTTPLFYHLKGYEDRLVAEQFSLALKRHKDARVWLPLFSDQMPTEDMEEALQCLKIIREFTSHNSRVLLFVPSRGKETANEKCKQRLSEAMQQQELRE